MGMQEYESAPSRIYLYLLAYYSVDEEIDSRAIASYRNFEDTSVLQTGIAESMPLIG